MLGFRWDMPRSRGYASHITYLCPVGSLQKGNSGLFLYPRKIRLLPGLIHILINKMKQFYYYLFLLLFCSSCGSGTSSAPGDLEKVKDYNAVGTWESQDGRYLFLYPDSCFLLRDLCSDRLPYHVSPDSSSVSYKWIYCDGFLNIMDPDTSYLNIILRPSQDTETLSLKERNGTWQIRPWDDGLQYAQLIGSWDTFTSSYTIYPKISLHTRAEGKNGCGLGDNYVYKCPVCQKNLTILGLHHEWWKYLHHLSDTIPTDIDAFIRYRKQHPELKCSFWAE